MFEWSSLTPSTNLSWAACYTAFQCARFTVPLQYSNTSAGDAQIAVIMSPSNLSHTDPNYLGPFLFNPGGPGSSGVQTFLADFPLLQSVIGPYYDIVSFDPRAQSALGVGNTTPAVSFFASPAEALLYRETFPNNANESASSFGRSLAQSQVLAKLASDRIQLVAESVGTPAVAADMLNIVRAFGQEKLNYYGISYGSLLGSTFAAMFPENVGRFVLDGVVNAHDYYAGNRTNTLSSTDDTLTSIYDSCVAAGPQLCPIYENSTDLVRARVNAVLDSVHVAPLAAINDTDPSNIEWIVVDYTTLTTLLFNTLYTPYASAQGFAEAIVALEQGDPSVVLQAVPSPITDICPVNASVPVSDGTFDAATAIWFGDSFVDGNRTFAEAKANYDAALNLSAFAALRSHLCNRGSVLKCDMLTGSFITNTSTPILFIGNTFDPVTPLASAHNMSTGFTGSVVLQQNSTGHTSQSGFNLCTIEVIQAYLTNLTLPAPGTVCQPATGIWSINSTSLVGRSMDVRTREPSPLEEAVEAFARSSVAKRNMLLAPAVKRFSF
ncbi:hypothetical protein PHLGIDRAFT_101206 [Phlebiopsis gigantea 11061_1 CR5-6]|uniref:Uncharacterized protein n=1 Tax=Phlebiopsis gigantea (strain 11061_1 CR5-6) TaxID=745531 RepID=A0A0C3S487_PHLG1|nr:hypothetical protein PHLGIDRAFT_101206 [Phlebiopsis gigantea 11061_1 CR5-6]